MKIRYFSFALLLSFFFTIITHAQVTNLQVNGVSSNFTLASGDVFGWVFNIPVGSTTNAEIYYDVNQNGIIDASDALYAGFSITDGQNSNNGPGDGDGLVNGIITLSPDKIGLAPGKYILKFTEGGSSAIITGTITPMVSPAFTISGKVIVPTGLLASNFIIEMRRNGGSPNFWDAVTDVNGNYTIQMNSDTAGNPWQIGVLTDPYPTYTVSPSQMNITINKNLTDINFTVVKPDLQIGGTVQDDNGSLLLNEDVEFIRISNGGIDFQISTRSGSNGQFNFGLTADNLASNRTYFVWAGNNGISNTTTNRMAAIWNVGNLSVGDNLSNTLIEYYTNSQITGRVVFNGNPIGYQVTVIAMDLGTVVQSTVQTDNQGNFTIPVSNKFPTYGIILNNGQGNHVNASPGDNNVILDLGANGVKGENNGIPTTYSLNQNYPNPFNPSTTITFGIPERANVNLTVFNQLGQQVAVLVNEEMNPGMHSVNWKANNLSSGIYFYKLNAGNFSSVKKLMLLK